MSESTTLCTYQEIESVNHCLPHELLAHIPQPNPPRSLSLFKLPFDDKGGDDKDAHWQGQPGKTLSWDRTHSVPAQLKRSDRVIDMLRDLRQGKEVPQAEE